MGAVEHTCPEAYLPAKAPAGSLIATVGERLLGSCKEFVVAVGRKLVRGEQTVEMRDMTEVEVEVGRTLDDRIPLAQEFQVARCLWAMPLTRWWPACHTRAVRCCHHPVRKAAQPAALSAAEGLPFSYASCSFYFTYIFCPPLIYRPCCGFETRRPCKSIHLPFDNGRFSI